MFTDYVARILGLNIPDMDTFIIMCEQAKNKTADHYNVVVDYKRVVRDIVTSNIEEGLIDYALLRMQQILDAYVTDPYERQIWGYVPGGITSQTGGSIIHDILRDYYYYHHRAYGMGYISRKIVGTVHTYNGHFGEGFVVRTPSFESSQYSYRTYLIRKSDIL